MGAAELIFIALGLSADAFSVALCEGVKMRRFRVAGSLCTALSFGFFQAVMPLLGFYLGKSFSSAISDVNHWVAFLLLLILGIKMIAEAACSDEDEQTCGNYRINVREILILSIAVSIDAFAVGIVFAVQNPNIFAAVSVIGLITAFLAFSGTIAGHIFGSRFGKKAEIAGGAVLIIIGVKLLIQGL